MSAMRTRSLATRESSVTSPVIREAQLNEDDLTTCADEQLIVDDRADRRPAQMVEEKLSGMLKGDFAMVSQLRMKRLIGRRS